MSLKTAILGDDTHRPSITLAQLVGAVPLVANLLASWGVFAPTVAQQQSLSDLLTWGYVLIAGDAALRIGRNVSDALKARQPAAAEPATLVATPSVVGLADADIEKLALALAQAVRAKPAARASKAA